MNNSENVMRMDGNDLLSMRAIPVSKQYVDNMMLKITPAYARNEYVTSRGIGDSATAEQPFNPKLNEIIMQHEKVQKSLDNTKRKTWLTKWQNKSNNTINNNALYDTRQQYNINAQNHIGNILPTRLRDEQLSKIHTPKTWMKDIPAMHQFGENNEVHFEKKCKGYDDIENNCENCQGTSYYQPNLPVSETNKPTHFIDIPSPDERIANSQQVMQRPYMSEGDKVYTAMKLRQNPEIINRNRVQEESNNLLKRTGALKQPRWNECKQYFNSDTINNKYDVGHGIEKEAFSSYNQRNTGKMKSDARCDFTDDGLNIDNTIKYNNYSNDAQFENMNREKKSNKFNNKNNITPEDEIEKKTTFDTICDAVISFFNPKRNKNKLIDHKRNNVINCNSHDISNNYSVYNGPNGQSDMIAKKKMYNKSDHIFIVKTGEVSDVYPDDDYVNSAPLLLTVDPITKRPIRTFATSNNKFLYIIQRRNPDFIFVDGNKIGEDYIAVQIPIQDLAPKFRNKIDKKNSQDTGRNKICDKDNKILEFNYQDLTDLQEYIEARPDSQIRIKHKIMYNHLRGNEYDKEIGINFESRKVFANPEFVNNYHDEIRNKYRTKIRSRQDVDQDQYTPNVPVMPSHYSEEFQKPNNNVHNYTCSRNTPISRMFSFEK